jgi:hypothetical protein
MDLAGAYMISVHSGRFCLVYQLANVNHRPRLEVPATLPVFRKREGARLHTGPKASKRTAAAGDPVTARNQLFPFPHKRNAVIHRMVTTSNLISREAQDPTKIWS